MALYICFPAMSFVILFLFTHAFLLTLFTIFFIHTGIAADVKGYIWTGLNDIAKEGTFTWEDGSPVS